MSTRGRFNSLKGVIAKTSDPARGFFPQGGRAPISANACATSSPPVRMLAVPQADNAIARGHSPAFLPVTLDETFSRKSAYPPRRRRSAPPAHRTAKKLRPVGSTSGRPRVGAPMGPAG